GSRKKILSIILGCASAFYIICGGIARIMTGDHAFSDVLISGVLGYGVILFVYYILLDIPGQEMIFRHKLTYGPFNDGLKLILEGKSMLKDNQEAALQKVSAGLEKFTQAKAKAEEISKYGKDYSAFISRIDDLTSRIGILLQAQPLNITKWSYVC
nr:hypothetical protein [Candidatus Sigynarchaeota archaeon]